MTEPDRLIAFRVPGADDEVRVRVRVRVNRGDRVQFSNAIGPYCEGANIPCTADAVDTFGAAGVLCGPGKAANAGGVAMLAFGVVRRGEKR